MRKEELNNFKNKLKQKKEELEKMLKEIAQKEDLTPGEWKAKFPYFGERSPNQDESVDEVEEYSQNLVIENRLDFKLLDVKRALEKIKTGRYGICEKCGSEISKKRLEILPETKYCTKCTLELNKE